MSELQEAIRAAETLKRMRDKAKGLRLWRVRVVQEVYVLAPSPEEAEGVVEAYREGIEKESTVPRTLWLSEGEVQVTQGREPPVEAEVLRVDEDRDRVERISLAEWKTLKEVL